MTALATISDVQAVVAQTVDVADIGFVTRVIEMASARVIRYTGQQFLVTSNDTVVMHPHDGELRLPQRPVTSVTSVTVGTTLITSTAYEVHSNGYLRRTLPFILTPDAQFGVNGITQQYGMQWPANGEFGWPPFPTTVVYTHGYAAVPDDVAGVIAELVAAKYWGGLRQASGLVSEAIDTYKETYFRNEPTTEWMPAHKKILDSYRRSGFASVRLG
jgi:hypothetical protein